MQNVSCLASNTKIKTQSSRNLDIAQARLKVHVSGDILQLHLSFLGATGAIHKFLHKLIS